MLAMVAFTFWGGLSGGRWGRAAAGGKAWVAAEGKGGKGNARAAEQQHGGREDVQAPVDPGSPPSGAESAPESRHFPERVKKEASSSPEQRDASKEEPAAAAAALSGPTRVPAGRAPAPPPPKQPHRAKGEILPCTRARGLSCLRPLPVASAGRVPAPKDRPLPTCGCQALAGTPGAVGAAPLGQDGCGGGDRGGAGGGHSVDHAVGGWLGRTGP